MGVIYAIKCRTCNVMRNVDKLVTLIVPAENRSNALKQCTQLEPFRGYLLASFLKEHEGHDCTLLNDTDPNMEAEYYSSGEEAVDFWDEDKPKFKEYPSHLCPSTGREDCSMCSGEYCATHFNRPCDCDTAERHIPDRD